MNSFHFLCLQTYAGIHSISPNHEYSHPPISSRLQLEYKLAEIFFPLRYSQSHWSTVSKHVWTNYGRLFSLTQVKYSNKSFFNLTSLMNPLLLFSWLTARDHISVILPSIIFLLSPVYIRYLKNISRAIRLYRFFTAKIKKALHLPIVCFTQFFSWSSSHYDDMRITSHWNWMAMCICLQAEHGDNMWWLLWWHSCLKNLFFINFNMITQLMENWDDVKICL